MVLRSQTDLQRKIPGAARVAQLHEGGAVLPVLEEREGLLERQEQAGRGPRLRGSDNARSGFRCVFPTRSPEIVWCYMYQRRSHIM